MSTLAVAGRLDSSKARCSVNASALATSVSSVVGLDVSDAMLGGGRARLKARRVLASAEAPACSAITVWFCGLRFQGAGVGTTGESWRGTPTKTERNCDGQISYAYLMP